MNSMTVIGLAVLVVAGHRALRRWEKRQQLELEALEREALDATIRWAYSHGLMQTFGDDYDVVVQEFRLRWGDKRREVRK